MDIWIATTNKGKISEVKIILEKYLLPQIPKLEIFSINKLPHYSPPPENGKTFLENALIKAKSLKALKPGFWLMAEDSGLEVQLLNSLPGVHSARYAGPKATDKENLTKLLNMLQLKGNGEGVPAKARFYCSMVVFTPQGKEVHFEGSLEGTISKTPKGTSGFGYDPVFIPTGQTQTLAELGLAYKNQHSHRAQACKKWVDFMVQSETVSPSS